MATNRDSDIKAQGEVLRGEVDLLLQEYLDKAARLIEHWSTEPVGIAETDDKELMAAFRVRAALLAAYAAIEDMPQYDDLDEARDSHGDEGKA